MLPAAALSFLASKGLQPTGAWTEWLDGQHARAFTVANVAKLDVLQDIRDSLLKAMAEGQTLQAWKDGLVPQLQRKGWIGSGGTLQQLQAAGRIDDQGVIRPGLSGARLQNIFSTNMQSAYMAGRYAEQIDQAQERPYWEYVAILDARTRPAHRAMHGRIFRYDDPGWRSFYPPCGYRCRCRVRTFSQLDVARRKLTVDSTDGKLEQVQVPLRDGGSATVTRYVDRSLPGGRFQPDVGFSNNPGLLTWQPTLNGRDVQLSRRYVETAVQGPAFERFVAPPPAVRAMGPAEGAFPVSVPPAARQGQLGMSGPSVILPAQAIEASPGVDVAAWRQLPDLIEQGELLGPADGGGRVLQLVTGGQRLQATLGDDPAGAQVLRMTVQAAQ